MYKYAKDLPPISPKELNISDFITLQKNDLPLIKLAFSIDTAYLKRDLNLDLILRNLSEDNLSQTEKTVSYILKNFSKLFETAWTTLYHHLCKIDPKTATHTLEEFFTEQIDFDNPYYTIQIELNSRHLQDGAARYCFVAATVNDYGKWSISDDNMRVYMIGNIPCGINTNNDDGQMCESLEDCAMFYGMDKVFDPYLEQMEQNGFEPAEPFETV